MTTCAIHKLAFVLLFAIMVGQLAQAQANPWSVQTQQILGANGNVSFTKIDAPKGDTLHVMAVGIAGAMNVVCRTTNSGATWDVPLQRYFQEPKMNDLSHPTSNVAVIVGDTMYRDTGSTIFYTHNGGDTWQQGWCDSCNLADGSRYHLWRVSMCDSMNGIMSAFLSCLTRTTDGGATWHRIADPTNGEELFYGLQCLSPSTYILSTSVFLSGISTVYRTTDSGKTWTHNLVARGTGPCDFIDPLHAWSTGYRNQDSTLYMMVARTTDSGVTWDTLFNAPALSWRDNDLRSISMADAMHGITIGGGGTWLYTNNGTTWQEGPNLDSAIFAKHTINLASVTYPHPDKAWATGAEGYILVYHPRTAAAPIAPGITVASLAAFPNPANAGAPVSITLPRITPGTDHVELSLVDLRGAVVATIKHSTTGAVPVRFTWPVPAEIPAGVYYLRLVNGTTVATFPLTVIH
jgi:photosystem II stability/assembly factor-like uncharacterized protein